jgi:hypothetical protein
VSGAVSQRRQPLAREHLPGTSRYSPKTASLLRQRQGLRGLETVALRSANVTHPAANQHGPPARLTAVEVGGVQLAIPRRI